MGFLFLDSDFVEVFFDFFGGGKTIGPGETGGPGRMIGFDSARTDLQPIMINKTEKRTVLCKYMCESARCIILFFSGCAKYFEMS